MCTALRAVLHATLTHAEQPCAQHTQHMPLILHTALTCAQQLQAVQLLLPCALHTPLTLHTALDTPMIRVQHSPAYSGCRQYGQE